MTVITSGNILGYIFWAIFGIILAYGFVHTQKDSVALIKSDPDQKLLLKLMGISLIRISVVVVIMYFAFIQSTWLGITCLLTFVVFRWIFLIISMKSIKN